MSQPKKDARTILPVKGAAPAAVEGYAVAEWDGRRSVLVSGGVDESGAACNDVFMLQLGGTTAGGAASEWRTLQQFPSSVFDGEPFTPRSEHTMTHVSGGGSDSFSFFIFGGKGADGGLLADLWAFDMANEAWSRPESLGTPPAPRSGHAACFVAARPRRVRWARRGESRDRYGVCVRHDDVDAADGERRVAARGPRPPRARWLDVDGRRRRQRPAAPSCPHLQCFPFAQKGCMEFTEGAGGEVAVAVAPGAPSHLLARGRLLARSSTRRPHRRRSSSRRTRRSSAASASRGSSTRRSRATPSWARSSIFWGTGPPPSLARM